MVEPRLLQEEVARRLVACRSESRAPRASYRLLHLHTCGSHARRPLSVMKLCDGEISGIPVPLAGSIPVRPCDVLASTTCGRPSPDKTSGVESAVFLGLARHARAVGLRERKLRLADCLAWPKASRPPFRLPRSNPMPSYSGGDGVGSAAAAIGGPGTTRLKMTAFRWDRITQLAVLQKADLFCRHAPSNKPSNPEFLLASACLRAPAA